MKKILFLSILYFLNFTLSFSANADILRYTDSQGQIHYVENLNKVPEQYRLQLKDAKPLPEISKSTTATYTDTYNAKTDDLFPSSNKKVEIFVTSWCPYCKKLEQYLNDNHIKYTKYDIETNSVGKKIHANLGGGGVPVVRIGSKVSHGFDPNWLGKALQG